MTDGTIGGCVERLLARSVTSGSPQERVIPRILFPQCRRAVAALLALGVALAFPPTARPADAQLGRLVKAAKDKAADKAKEAVAGTPAETAPAKKAAIPEDRTITAERLSAVLTALEPLVARAERQTALLRMRRDFTVRDSIAQACIGSAMQAIAADPMAMASRERTPAQERSEKQIAAQMERQSNALGEPGLTERDPLRFAFVADSFRLAQSRLTVVSYGLSRDVPYQPAELITQEVAERQRPRTEKVEATLNVAENARGGMSSTLFAAIRERAAPYALLQAGDTKAAQGSGSMGTFTDAERAVLAAREADLKRLAPYFRNGTLHWATGEDLSTW